MKRIKPQHFLILLLVAAIAAAPFLIRGLIDRSSVGKQPAAAVTAAPEAPVTAAETQPESLAEDGSYTTREDLALYIHPYGHLPDNFVTKEEARSAGWEGGGLDDVLPGMCIGGDRFGNREGLLPEATGRSWTECDVNTLHAKSRGAERIVFSNDGLIYYTGNHYDSFELLYDGK